MAKVIDLTNSDGDLVILGRALVLPSAITDSQPHPLNGSLRFNPSIGAAQLFHAGGWVTLGSGTGGTGPGDGTSNNHSHSISQITGLQNILNGKAALSHTHGLSDITGLSAALSAKADINHAHSIDGVTGLRGELDAKAALVHSHTMALKESISGCFPASPPANYKLVYTAPLALHFPIGLPGSYVKVGTPPALSYTVGLLKNNVSVGSIIISPSGTVVLNLPTALDLVAGDTLTFQCPARDTSINTISFSLLGTRDSQVTT